MWWMPQLLRAGRFETVSRLRRAFGRFRRLSDDRRWATGADTSVQRKRLQRLKQAKATVGLHIGCMRSLCILFKNSTFIKIMFSFWSPSPL